MNITSKSRHDVSTQLIVAAAKTAGQQVGDCSLFKCQSIVDNKEKRVLSSGSGDGDGDSDDELDQEVIRELLLLGRRGARGDVTAVLYNTWLSCIVS